MKKLLLIFITGFLLVFISCEKDEIQDVGVKENYSEQITLIDPSTPEDIFIQIPSIPRIEKHAINQVSTRSTPPPSSLLPDFFQTSAERGAILAESTTGILNLPSKADIMFHFDVSGSMGGEIMKFSENANQIVTTIGNKISDLNFGISYGCDQNNYGNFVNHCPLIPDPNEFANLMKLMGPPDYGTFPYPPHGGYEQYGFQFTRLALDIQDIGWRPVGTRKIVVAFLDEPVDAGDGYGPSETVDDGIQKMKENDVVLIVVYSGNSLYFQTWFDKASETLGCAFQTNTDGTIPGDVPISDFIFQKIEEVFLSVNEVRLEVLPPVDPQAYDYSDWLSSCAPPVHENVPAGTPVNFNVQFQIPLDAPFGIHRFDLSLMGDGAEFATQEVEIEVISPNSDNDDCIDEEDPHPYSIMDEMITIDGCETGVENLFVTDCSTMMDMIMDCASEAVSHGDFVSCIAQLTNEWKSEGLISGKEKGKIQRCAARSSIPES